MYCLAEVQDSREKGEECRMSDPLGGCLLRWEDCCGWFGANESRALFWSC